MFANLSQSVVFILAEVSIKALVLYGTTILILRMSRSLSVHAQHRAWNVVLLIWLFMPLVVLAGWSWSLPVASWNSGLSLDDTSLSATTPAMVNLTDETQSNRVTARATVLHELDSAAEQHRTIGLADVSTAASGVNPSTRLSEKPEATPKNTASPKQALLPLLYQAIFIVWGTGFVVMLARLAFAMLWTREICQRAQAIQEATLPQGLDVRESQDISGPVVVGWWRPCLLLPTAWRGWTESKRYSVLAHEQSHLRRGDTIVCFLSELLTVFYWFHPFSWGVKRRLGQLAELACDEAAAVQTGDRYLYAQHLVEIASAIPRTTRYPTGITMARSSEISHRVRSLLNVSHSLTSRASLPSLIAILTLGVPSALMIAAAEPDAAPQAREQSADIPPPAPLAMDVPAPAAPAVPANDAPNQPPFEAPILTLRGTAYLSDGTVAKDAIIVESQFQDEERKNDILSATISEGQFEIKTTATNFRQPDFLICTPDKQAMASLNIGGIDLRTKYMTPRKLVMSPAKTIRVLVTDSDKPVNNASVLTRVGNYNFLETSGNDGVAEINIPQDEDVFLISAWTADHKIDGLHAARKPSRDQFGTDFHLHVSKSDPARVRVVDAKQQPVAGVPVDLIVSGGHHSENFVGANPPSIVTSGANGESAFRWMPGWSDKNLYPGVVRNSGWRKVGEQAKKLPDGTLQLEVAPSRTAERIAVDAQVSGVTSDVSGMLVELWSFQGEEEHDSDVIHARTDAQGRFVARVLPGSTYCAYVNDTEYVSQIWDGMIVDWDGKVLNKPVIALTPGAPVEIQVTQGADHRPVVNGWVSLQSPHSFNYRHRDGSEESGEMSRRFWGRTNSQGIVRGIAAPGVLQITASDSPWSSTQKIQVTQGQPAKAHFHRQYADKQAIHGKLVLPPGVTEDLNNTEIKIAGMDGESEDTVTATSDAEGNFTCGIAAGRVSILATTPGERFFGCSIVDVRDKLIEVPIHPTVQYQGQVLGTNNEPVPGVSVRMMARLTDHQREYPSGTPAYQHQFVDLFKNRVVTTDASGQFLFPQTPQRMELSLYFTPPGEAKSETRRQVYLEPGSVRPAQVVRLGANSTSAPRPQKPLNESLAQTVLDCRLAGIHPLVVALGEGDPIARFVGAHITDPEMPHDSYSYYLRPIDGPAAEVAPDRKEYFAARNWPFPAKNAAFLVALDGEGKELGRLSVDLKDEPAAAQEVAAFLKQNLPPKVDARVGFEAALAEAKKSGRRLWARVGQTRCGPCFTFSRWLNDHKDVLAKDYVMFKFDDIRDLQGQELSKTLKFSTHGVPCHAIYDADGKELINSVGPQGNIGSPVGDAEAVGHLRKMLETTAQKLTAAEIDELIRSLDRE